MFAFPRKRFPDSWIITPCAFPSRNSEQWHDAGRFPTHSGGTVLDLHQLPFNPEAYWFMVHGSWFRVDGYGKVRYRRGRMRILPVSGSVSIQTAQPYAFSKISGCITSSGKPAVRTVPSLSRTSRSETAAAALRS